MFAPSSMTVGDGFIAAGGTSAQVLAVAASITSCCGVCSQTDQNVPSTGNWLFTPASQLDVRSLDGLFSFKGSVAGSVNNALHISKDQIGATCSTLA